MHTAGFSDGLIFLYPVQVFLWWPKAVLG